MDAIAIDQHGFEILSQRLIRSKPARHDRFRLRQFFLQIRAHFFLFIAAKESCQSSTCTQITIPILLIIVDQSLVKFSSMCFTLTSRNTKKYFLLNRQQDGSCSPFLCVTQATELTHDTAGVFDQHGAVDCAFLDVIELLKMFPIHCWSKSCHPIT